MNSFRIFVASSLEMQEELAAPIARALAEAGFSPVRWWTAFPAGEYTLLQLSEIARSVAGGVFVCGADDRTWYRGTPTWTPRSNVLLELGMFVQELGPKACVVVRSPRADLPSDLEGLTFIQGTHDVETVAERIVKHFVAYFQSNSRSRVSRHLDLIPIEVDPSVADLTLQRPLPKGWSQRALYLGPEGANSWLSLVATPGTLESRDIDMKRRQLLNVIRGIQVSTFISMGPGDAEKDYQLVLNLPKGSEDLNYIPVDISEALLERAYSRLFGHCRLSVGILSDFEERLPFIQGRLDHHGRRPFLVGLLGNTLGNLDRYELDFLQQIARWLQRGDCMLLEVTIASERWRVPTNLDLDEETHSDALRRFYAQGIARQTATSPDTLLQHYDERVAFSEGQSDVPDAASVEIFDRQTRARAINIRRYRWGQLLAWLRAELPFDVIQAEHFFRPGKEIGMGAVLLCRR